MRPALAVLLAAVISLALALAPSLAVAAPTMSVTTTCGYAGEQFAVFGRGFAPGSTVRVEIMGTADPLAGPALMQRTATVDAGGGVLAILDVPPTSGPAPVLRAARARAATAPANSPTLLATAQLRAVSRSVLVSGGARPAARETQRWSLTGLPEGTPLYAHFRRDGKTVARRSLGQATDPCGRLDFDLPVQLRGASELWMTADRTFRRPRRGVYVRRTLTTVRSRAGTRVRLGEIASRLAALDPRQTSPVTNGMAADISRIGVVDLTFVGAAGAPVEFFERVGDRLTRLGSATAPAGEVLTDLRDATPWSCDRAERRFVATSTRRDGGLARGTFSVRTPTCSSRFELTAPRRIRPGDVARVRVVDRWGIGGITPTLCITPPQGRRTCEPVELDRGVTVASRRFRASARGDWLVALRVRDRRIRKAVVAVGTGNSAAAVPTVLATGDSTMQGIDGFIGDELGDAVSVVSDVRIGTGISKSEQPSLPGAANPAALQWGLLAAEQTRRERQVAAVVSLGANEGFPMTAAAGARVECCDAPWTAEYARRVRLMMQTYARGGRARVLWLTLALPRDDRRLATTRAVNGAIVAAAAGLARVKVLRMDVVFTPDGYREIIRYRGRDVAVRDADGVHLNVAGTAIAARIVADELRQR